MSEDYPSLSSRSAFIHVQVTEKSHSPSIYTFKTRDSMNKTTYLPQMHVVVTAWEIESHTIPRRYLYNNSITFNNDVIGMN